MAIAWIIVLFGGLLVFAACVWAVAASVSQSGGGQEVPDIDGGPSDSRTNAAPAGGFPVIDPRPVLTFREGEDGPGIYRVVGVDRRSHEDAVVHLGAISLANAKVKAELRGIIVTQVAKAAS